MQENHAKPAVTVSTATARGPDSASAGNPCHGQRSSHAVIDDSMVKACSQTRGSMARAQALQELFRQPTKECPQPKYTTMQLLTSISTNLVVPMCTNQPPSAVLMCTNKSHAAACNPSLNVTGQNQWLCMLHVTYAIFELNPTQT